ncbi:MAG: DNA methyltransferase, partial [Ignavibacteria bacterium]|nr:DNA methyltransferase [Ignavibacteria bacterium]
KPKVRCFLGLKNRGAGMPDGGLFTAEQFEKVSDLEPLRGQVPARGVIEVKSPQEDVSKTARSDQAERYARRYRLVLVTNYRDFLLIGMDAAGKPTMLEAFHFAGDEEQFWLAASHPRRTADDLGPRFVDYIKRVMLHAAPLGDPKDVAWFLASYARDAKVRTEKGEMPAVANVRSALEDALGLKFQGPKGEHFFRSSLVQTLFYGIFSAWVLCSKQHRNTKGRAIFDWRTTAHHLRVPVLRKLFHELAEPGQLDQLRLSEVLDWTASTLNRVVPSEFFSRFEEEHAVQYFYEPFLEAFDPELRKELGVWYTPREIVQYMVARVDTVLRTELGLKDGLADKRVYVLDPCCGTGAYLVEVLKRIAETLKAKGGDALVASDVKEAAMKRVFGFEILPAPFVVSHLQLGLLLQNLGAPLADEGHERIGVYLTNALTGWEPPKGPKEHLGFPELEEERDAAEHVKRDTPILVILGNPPYNAFAGVSPAEEQGLVEPYKEGLIKQWGIKKFNLDDLYVRFFRLAERRIAEKTGKGVICFISNFSYLGDPSFVVMRKRFLQEFDKLWFDCMNGDSRETGKLTPDGKPDPSVFSTEYNREGIRVGTTIGLIVRTEERAKEPVVRFRHFWGVNKKLELLDGLRKRGFDNLYRISHASDSNRFSFRPSVTTHAYGAWPKLTELCSIAPMNGLMEKRGGALIEMDRRALEERMRLYFSAKVSWEELVALKTGLTEDAARFDARKTRDKILRQESFNKDRIRRYALRPFEARWCYYSPVRPLWNEPRPILWQQSLRGNSFLMCRPAGVASPEGVPLSFTRLLGDNDYLRGHAYYFPVLLVPEHMKVKKGQEHQLQFEATSVEAKPMANLSAAARGYLTKLSIRNPDTNIENASLIWMHALAIGYSPAYLKENADGMRQDWPRIPLPKSAEMLERSAALGRKIASLLDTENDVRGVTSGTITPEMKHIAVIESVERKQLRERSEDLALTAGWGHAGKD